MDSILSWAVLTALVIVGCIRFCMAYIQYEDARKRESEEEWRSIGK